MDNRAKRFGDAVTHTADAQGIVGRVHAGRLGDMAQAMAGAEIDDESVVDALLNYAVLLGMDGTEDDLAELYQGLAEATLVS